MDKKQIKECWKSSGAILLREILVISHKPSIDLIKCCRNLAVGKNITIRKHGAVFTLSFHLLSLNATEKHLQQGL